MTIVDLFRRTPDKPVAVRTPVETPGRIAPLAILPLFHKLEGRKVVLAGNSDGAVWKADLLSAAGAELVVLAGDAEGAKKFQTLAENPVAGTVAVMERGWRDADLAGAALAVADVPSEEGVRFATAAREAGAPVNIVDQPELGDFQFGTIVNRSPVVLGISTDGAAPMFGQSIRTRIESVLPPGIAAWGQAAKTWRPQVKARIDSFRDRRGFWKAFNARAWSRIERAPTDADREALFDTAARHDPVGSVTLVGAGPGDPELLTLKAVRALQLATVILYDDLVGPDILELARREAKRIAVGKTGGGASCKQSDINAQIVALALAGEDVVRLKGGDPLVFGRATEELDACAEAGIEATIVPGISAAQAVAATSGFSLTEREVARRVQYITGHAATGKLPRDVDWQSVAHSATTTVLYMPRRTLGDFLNHAFAAGLDPATPAMAAVAVTRAEEQKLVTNAGALAAGAATLPADQPMIVVIGHVVHGRGAVAQTMSQAIAS